MMSNLIWARRVLAAFVFSIAFASTAQAGACGYEYCWGAVAAGPNGVAARASGLGTAPDAAARAAEVCLGNCSVTEVFVDGCGAIAEGRDSSLSSGFATDKENAIAEALFNCGGDDKACRVRVWACSQ